MAIVSNKFWETDPKKILINQVLRGTDINKNRKKMLKYLGKICVKIKPNFWVLRSVFDDYIKATTQNLPAGYGWVTPQDLYEESAMNKNGQASTGNIYERVRAFETTGIQIINTVIINDNFLIPHFDKKLNKQLERDYYKVYDIEVDKSKTTRSTEVVLVPNHILFTDFHQMKIKSLENLLNENVSTDSFRGNESQLRCLTKMKKWARKFRKLFLLDCVMRFGKSYIYYEFLKQNYVDKGIYKIHAVFCHDTKTRSGWIKKAERAYNGLFDVIELNNARDFDFNQKVTKNTIVLISQQLLHSNKTNKSDSVILNVESNLKELIKFDIKLETAFVDECHNYFSRKWKDYFESISKKIILASGTAANIKIKYKDEFDEENVHTDTILDLIERFKKLYNINIKINLKRLQLSDVTKSKEINISNLQELSQDDKTKLQSPLFADKFCEWVFDPSIGYLTSPFTTGDIDIKAVPIYCETVAMCQHIKDWILKHPELKIRPIMAAGPKRDVKDESELEWQIEKNRSDGYHTLMLTAGAFIQGISIKYFKDLMNLSAKTTYEIFYQYLGRIFEISPEDSYGQDVIGNMWDYFPQRTIMVGSEFADSMSISNSASYTESIRIFFRPFNIQNYIPKGDGAWVNADIKQLDKEIRKFGNSSLFKKGCRARLILDGDIKASILELGNKRPELLKLLRETKITKKEREALDAYKSDLKKGKSNYTESDRLPSVIKTAVDKLIDALSVYTERIPFVAKVLCKQGIISNLTVKELMSNFSNKMFQDGFCFPNTETAEQFASYIEQYGISTKIDKKISDEFEIPNMIEYLDLEKDEFFRKCAQYDDLYRYDGDYTQLSVKDAYDLLKREISKNNIKLDKKFHVTNSKSGSIQIALARILSDKTTLSKEAILQRITFSEENKFHSSSSISMGFTKGVPDNKDFIIINPPYKGKELLHLKLFLESFKRLNNNGLLICLHPSTQILNDGDGDITKEFRKILKEYETTITLVDGNKLFNAGFFTPLSVTRVRKTKNISIKLINKYFDDSNNEVIDIKDIEDIYVHPSKSVISIRDKIVGRMNARVIKSITEYLYRTGYTKGSHYIKFVTVSGHPPVDNKINPDFYQMLYKANQHDINDVLTTTPKGRKKNGGIYNELGFSSIEEATNGFDYLKTKFVRFCLSLKKTGQNLNLCDMEYIPYMNFDETWDDEKLFDYFDFTTEERHFVDSFIGDWYECDSK